MSDSQHAQDKPMEYDAQDQPTEKERKERRAMIAALRVGCDVSLGAGVYSLDGRVVDIKDGYVYVKTDESSIPYRKSYLVRFNAAGELVEDGPWWLRAIPAEGGQCFLSRTFSEEGQANMDKMREQLREDQREWEKRNCPLFLAWWKSAPYEQRLALVKEHYQNCLASLPPDYGADFVKHSLPAEDVAKLADISKNTGLMS